MFLFITIRLLIIGVETTLSFKSSCPAPTLWKQVAVAKCSNVPSYHCLYDVDQENYKEMCFRRSKHPAGSRVIFDTLLNAERCAGDRYQPLPYYSNELNDCIYEKSICNEEGQIIFSNGTFTTDRKCRCDHENGYAFLSPTKYQCFCTPSNEDCSCYLKKCSNSSFVLSSGFKCVPRPITTNECSFTTKRLAPTDRKEQSKRTSEYDRTRYNIKTIEEIDKYPIMGLVCVTIVVVLMIAVVKGKDWIFTLKESGLTEFEMKTLKNDLFIAINGYHEAEMALTDHGIVIIKGRYGTGKSTVALHLALPYHEKGYKPYKYEKFESATKEVLIRNLKQNQKLFIILENVVSDGLQILPDLKKWKALLSVFSENRNNMKVIITSYFINQELRDGFLQNIGKGHYDVVDLDNSHYISRQNKMEILKGYCEKFDRPFIDEIVDCDPVVGFPLMCTLFCSDDCNFLLAKTFFINPPLNIVEKFENIKNSGIGDSFEAIKYSALVYIALKEDGKSVCFDKDSIDLTLFCGIFKNVFHKDFANDVTNIQNAASSFKDQCLESSDVDKLRFGHKGLKQAVLITYGQVAPNHLLQYASIEDILDIVRPMKYRRSTNESVVQISTNDDCYRELSNRIANSFAKSSNMAKKIGSYLGEYGVKCNDIELMEIIFEAFKRHTSEVMKTILKSFKQRANDIILKVDTIPFLIDVFYEMTSGSSSAMPTCIRPIGFRLICELVSAGRYSEIDTLRNLFINWKTESIPDENLNTTIDEYGNTLLHYIVVWGHADGISLINDHIVKNQKSNNVNFSPLFFAAYMGRSIYFNRLLQNSDKKSSEKDRTHFENLKGIIRDGFKLSGTTVSNDEQTMKINKHIAASISFGNHKQFMEITSSLFTSFGYTVEDLESLT